jgi:ubiquinone biosynthesis protein COQ4
LLPKLLLPTLSAFGSILHPERADLVALSTETIGYITYEKLLAQLKADTEGRRILNCRPRISSQTLLRAGRCQTGTLGKSYATFMEANRFKPDDRPPVRFIRDEETRFVATRAREIHDLLHILFDCPTTIKGELTIKGIEFIQYGLPIYWASTYFAANRLSAADRYILDSKLLPWAVQVGSRVPSLICCDYEQMFHLPLEQIRDEWHLSTNPWTEVINSYHQSHVIRSEGGVQYRR